MGAPTEESRSLVNQLNVVFDRFIALQTETANQFKGVKEDMIAMTNAFNAKIQNMEDELSILKKAVCGHSIHGKAPLKVKVPDPRTFTVLTMPRSLRISYGIWSSISRLLMFLMRRKSRSQACISLGMQSFGDEQGWRKKPIL